MSPYSLHPHADAPPMATVSYTDAPRVLAALTGRPEATVRALLGPRYMRPNRTTGVRGVYIAGAKGHQGVVVRRP